MTDTLDLLSWRASPPQHNQPGMHRRDDAQTSIDASEYVAKSLPEKQAAVYRAFVANGPMTDAELDALPQFKSWRPSTARCRRKELRNDGYLFDTGEVKKIGRCNLIVWAVKVKA